MTRASRALSHVKEMVLDADTVADVEARDEVDADTLRDGNTGGATGTKDELADRYAEAETEWEADADGDDVEEKYGDGGADSSD